tara:strand:+ start:266 stop:958 length:693 start_codon:yes stop_codon:yes gene_type:complete
MTKEITNIIGELVAKIDNVCIGIYDSVTTFTMICDTKYLRVGKKVTNEAGDEYMVTKVVEDEYIEVTPLLVGSPNLDGKIYLPPPFYISGTKMATNREWTISTSDMTSKTPLAWLLELIRLEKQGRGSSVNWRSDLRMFFLDETDIQNYYTKDHRDNVVEPMSRLAQLFMKVIDEDLTFESIDDYELITFSRFGVETERGMFENILDANLSGVELRLTLGKYKGNCHCEN